jgi:hypothetical protein
VRDRKGDNIKDRDGSWARDRDGAYVKENKLELGDRDWD